VRGICNPAAQIRGDRLSINYTRAHDPLPCRTSLSACGNFLQHCDEHWPSPEMTSRLMRAVAPATRLTSRGGTPTALAISFISAALASPSLAPHAPVL